MSAPAAVDPVEDAAAQHDGPASGGSSARSGDARRKVVRYLMPPLLIGVAAALTIVWINSLTLDSIEQRALLGPNEDFAPILNRLTEHLGMTVRAATVTLFIAVPLGILVTRPWASALRGPALLFANVGQSAPSFGVISFFVVALLAPVFNNNGYLATLTALVAYAILPILANTIAGIQAVDETLIESAKGMGLSDRQVLTRVELPLAVPVVLAGVRTALVLTVGTATLGALFPGFTGLGQIIFQGYTTSRLNVMFVGAIVVALVALTVDYIASIVEDVLRPRGL